MKCHALPLTALAPALAIMLAGCTHIGTNVAGEFACRAQTGRFEGPSCQPLSEVDAQAIRQLLKAEGAEHKDLRQRAGIVAADTARTGERTLRVVFPAHVDASGTLHEQAAAWTVVEAPRWTGELRRGEAAEPKGTIRALRQALKNQARRADQAARMADTEPNPGALPRESGAPADTASPFIPSSPPVLPSPGGEVQADVPPSAAEGSDMPPTPHDRAPRPLEESPRVWPSAAAIEAAKAATPDKQEPR